MKYNLLGETGLLVTDICLGTMIFGENSERGTQPEDAARIIDAYLDAGGNHIDTANVYAGGNSEEIVGKAIKQKRDQIVLATKVRFPKGDDPNAVGLSRFHIMQAVEASLRRLDTDHIDLYYMHCWDELTPIEESLRAFEDLVQQGKVRYIGVSNFKAWQLMKALAISDANGWARFVAGQYQYSLVKRDIEYEFDDLFLSEGVGLMPWSPLGGGFLTGKYQRERKPSQAQEGRLATTPEGNEEAWQRRSTERNWQIMDVVQEIAKTHDATPTQVSLAWLRAQPTVSSIIIGPRTMEQLTDNMGAAELDLSDEEVTRLDEVSALPELYPYRFIENANKSRLEKLAR